MALPNKKINKVKLPGTDNTYEIIPTRLQSVNGNDKYEVSVPTVSANSTLVTSVNGTAPDASGNVTVEGSIEISNGGSSNWSEKTWTGLSNFNGSKIWTDGENTYYSNSTNQYILNKSASTWSSKTWNGIPYPEKQYVWIEGANVYYSNSRVHRILNKSTSTWESKTWSGLTDFYAENTWTDGENFYYSQGSNQKILDTTTSTWSNKSWSGLTSFFGSEIWTDGENIYRSTASSQKVLDKSTSTWSNKTWTGLTNIEPQYIWFSGDDVYYSNGNNQYVLNKLTSTWTAVVWTGLASFSGENVWTDGENIYYSYYDSSTGEQQYQLDPATHTATVLSLVAETGSYNDLTDAPALGTAAGLDVGTASGEIPVLDANGKLNTSVLPALAITNTYVVANEAAMLALDAQVGDVAVRTDLNKSYILKEAGASTLANWQELLTPTDTVLSVNGQTGAVVLASDNISDTNQTNKFVTATEKSTWSGKQDAIDSTHKLSADLVDDTSTTNKFVNATEKSYVSEHTLNSLNLFDKDNPGLIYGIGYEPNPTSTTGSDWVKVSWIPVEPNTTYSVNKNIRYSLYNGSWSDIGSTDVTSFTTASDTQYLLLIEYRGGTQTPDTSKAAWANLMLVKGSTAQSYQPYNRNEHITNQDVENIDKALYNVGAFDSQDGATRQTWYVDLGKLNWSKDGDNRFYNRYGGNMEVAIGDNVANIKCSKYVGISENAYSGRTQVGVSIAISDNIPTILIYDTNYNDVDTFKASLQGIILQYKLATSYADNIIPNQPLLNLDSNGCNFLRNEWEKGLNLWNYKGTMTNTNVGITATLNNSVLTLSGTNDGSGGWSLQNIPLNLKAGTYTIKYNGISSNYGFSLNIYDSSDNLIVDVGYVTEKTFTTSTDATHCSIWITGNGFGYGDQTIQIMLNEADHAYPYQKARGEIMRSFDYRVETWTFNMADGTTVTKKVLVLDE